jgi:hypothetical protein
MGKFLGFVSDNNNFHSEFSVRLIES